MGTDYSKQKTKDFQNPPKVDLEKVLLRLKKTKSIKEYNILLKNKYNINEMIFKTIFPKKKKDNIKQIKHLNNSFEYYNNKINEEDFKIKLNRKNKSFENKNCEGSDLEDISENKLFKNIKENEKQKEKNEKIRKSYYEKLILKGEWNPIIKEEYYKTFFFFDWDDTLMCTSYLSPNGIFTIRELKEKDIKLFNKLDNIVYNILRKTIKLGEVNIITNATSGWVEYSMRKFYPKSTKYLYYINIISARSLYEKKFPGDMKQWKILAFNDFLNHIQNSMLCNILCFGDSIIEIEAGHSFSMNLNNSYIKTIKFKESPSPNDLYKQLHLINNQLGKIYSSVRNLTIKVEKKKNDD